MKKLNHQKLVLATHNKGKLREIAELLAPYEIEVTSVGELDLPVPDETGNTFAENALIKARAAAQATGLPALSDDSGLCVEALGGAPGIYSADWAGPDKDFQAAMQRVSDEVLLSFRRKLESSSVNPQDPGLRRDDGLNTRAHFTCVLALVWPDGREEVFEGHVHGHLVWPPRGDQGFGYDPMFVPEGHTKTFGEMDQAAKHAMSHRAQAFEKFKARICA